MKKTLVIEVDVETKVPGNEIEPLLQRFIEGHSFLQKLSFPLMAAKHERMKIGSVRVSIRNKDGATDV